MASPATGNHEKCPSDIYEEEAPHGAQECPICYSDRMKDATVICPCGHTLCGHCATRCRDSACPICRTNVHQLLPVFALRELIEHDRLNPVVKCKHCHWTGRKEHFSHHYIAIPNAATVAQSHLEQSLTKKTEFLIAGAASDDLLIQKYRTLVRRIASGAGEGTQELVLVNQIVDAVLVYQQEVAERGSGMQGSSRHQEQQLQPKTATEWITIARSVSQEPFLIAGVQHTKQTCCLQALALESNSSVAWHILGNTLLDDQSVLFKGQPYNRRACCLQALRFDSANGKAWNNLVTTMSPGETVHVGTVGQFTMLECCARAVLCDPSNATFWTNLGNMLGNLLPTTHTDSNSGTSAAPSTSSPTVKIGNRIHTRQTCYVTALARDPTKATAWLNLATTLTSPHAGGESSKAIVAGETHTKITCFVKALHYDPYNAKAWNNLSATLQPTEMVLVGDIQHDQLTCLMEAVTMETRYNPNNSNSATASSGSTSSSSSSGGAANLSSFYATLWSNLGNLLLPNQVVSLPTHQTDVSSPLSGSSESTNSSPTSFMKSANNNPQPQQQQFRPSALPKQVNKQLCYAEALNRDPFRGIVWERLSKALGESESIVVNGQRHNRESCLRAAALCNNKA